MPSLSDFIRTHSGVLIDDWVAYALALNEGRSRLSEHDLRDSAPEILAALEANMCQSQTAQQAIDKSHGEKRASDEHFDRVCQLHAQDRLRQGFGLSDIVAEFRALRASVMRRWRASTDADALSIEEMERFHEAIDQVLSESVKEYVEQAERARNLFAGILAHDLRAPLGVIVNAATLIARTNDTHPELTKAAGFIQRSAASMNVLIDDLLVFARTRLGDELPLAASPQNMGEICREVAEEMGSVLDGKTIDVTTSGNLDGVWDRGRIAQLLANLLSNAARYGKGKIRLSAHEHEETIEINVENAGTPIPAEALPTIFDPLTRINAVTGHRDMAAGAGLGLYICRCITVAHQGSITAESDKARTKFTIRLPRRSDAGTLGPACQPPP
ncbi:sensor histidine kinase [Achromobacter aloeverae]|uniref:histidine kinase n=1 Tax=Achromobacter aloeverae TaxID=1750518 RepID=A0A4Q1HHH8_9BURK|nr:sensor histidine kinase [Achromobacter aloeverae]RXN86877.1 two-component sensor histidine kinase [Achromobacter aloeverae]